MSERGGLRAFEARWRGLSEVTAHFAAESAGKARALAARVLDESWSVPFGRALRELRVRRAPWKDLDAAMRGYPGGIDDVAPALPGAEGMGEP